MPDDHPPLNTPVVVTGFEPYHGRKSDASTLIGTTMAADADDTGFLLLPVRWGDPAKLVSQWERPPKAWIALGESGSSFKIEAIATTRRVMHLDNLGELPPGQEVRENGPPLLCPSPLVEIAAALSAAGYPVGISEDAGGYLCNELFYELLHSRTHVWKEPSLIIFLHVPVFGTPLPEAVAPTGGGVSANAAGEGIGTPVVMDEAYFRGFARVLLRVVRALLSY